MTTYASDLSVVHAPTDAEEVVDVETVDDTPAPTPTPPAGDAVDGEVVDAETATDVATVDADTPWTHEADWKYDELDFYGDLIAFRVPHQNALTALYQSSAHCSDERQVELTNRFVTNHLSPATIERVIDRMSDPDDTDYTSSPGIWQELLTKIAEIGGQRAIKDAEALAAIQAPKGK